MTMFHGETPAPQRRPSEPGDPRCERARERLSASIAAGRAPFEDAALREHLALCEDCNDRYREQLLADARLRRTLVQAAASLPEEPAPVRRAVLSPVAVARAGFGSGSRGKAGWVVALGVVCYAAVRLTPDPSGVARAHVSALEGRVMSAGDPLEVGAAGQDLQRGDWVRTPEDGRANVRMASTRVVVGESSVLQIEEPSTRRLRLEGGTLEVDGPLTVTSRFGVVEVEGGHARLSLGRAGLLVESTQGGVRTLDAQGERVLEAGESASLAFAN